MNFIDKAFKEKLQGNDFLQAMASIYSEPKVRETLDKYPQFVKDVILIIDYDGEITMGGLHEVIYGNLEEELPNILSALENCGATQEADVLRRAKNMTQEQYEAEYEKISDELALNNDYNAFWDLVRNYIDKSLKA